MIISIHQPSYWPWLGLLDKIAKSDVFVILDNVQLNKDSYQRRNIFCASGKKKYLTVSIDYHLGVKINEARIKDPEFPQKHYQTLRDWYMKSEFFDDVNEIIEPIYRQRYERLIDIINKSMFASLDAFGIKTKVLLASKIEAAGAKGNLVFNICQDLKADRYLSGKGALGYFQEDDYRAFEESGIAIDFQEFTHPVYPQFNSAEFIPGLGCLDVLFNRGVTRSWNLDVRKEGATL